MKFNFTYSFLYIVLCILMFAGGFYAGRHKDARELRRLRADNELLRAAVEAKGAKAVTKTVRTYER